MKRLGLILGVTVLMILSVVGCKRRPLDYYYRPTCRVILNVDWTHFPETPSGMTAFFYRDGDDTPILYTTAEVHSTELELKAGHYRGFVINQSPEEFWTVGFNHIDVWEEVRASLAVTRTKWYVTRDGADDSYVSLAPENLGVAHLEEFEITDEMVERYQAQYSEWKTKTKSYAETKATESEVDEAKRQLDELTYVINTVAYNVTCELKARVYVQGIYNLYSARASMTGLANDYMFSQRGTGEETTVQLMDSDTWHKTVYDADPTRGYIETSITTLGLPNGIVDHIESRDPSLNLFGLSCLLVDRATQIDADYNVGNSFTIEDGIHGLKLTLNLELGSMDAPAIVLPDVPPYGGDDKGFDATVTDWEEGETIEIPM